MSNLYTYSIMPLNTEYLDEICEDIKNQYEQGISTCPLFSMTLTPEDSPAINKAKIFCEKYKLFKDKLDKMNVPSGVLVQATIGHGWVLGKMFSFQQYVNFNNGEAIRTVCPYDEGFKEYIYEAFKTIASYKPASIMVDDDFRLMFRDGGGCACPLHMKRFNELANENLSREELWEIVSKENDKRQEYTRIMVETQKESLLECAKAMRKGIDAVDPELPASFCCVGSNAEFASEIAEILRGEGNPTVVRINNGNYTALGTKFFSRVFMRAANQIAKLKGKADVILAETDTCPQNRYSTSATSLHAHFTGTILEGARGAKHWITRMSAYEPESGKAYRKILAKHTGFYEKLAQIVPTLSWRGLRINVKSTPEYVFGKEYSMAEGTDAWSSCVLERLGLPMYFSNDIGGVLCLEGDGDKAFTNEEIFELLKGDMFLASDSAQKLIGRGFGEYLGVDVREWNGLTPVGELLLVNNMTTKCQQKVKEIVPLKDSVKIYSHVYNSVGGGEKKILFPGVTSYENSLGGRIFVFAGTPDSQYNIIEAFSFLTYSRKLQMIEMLKETDELKAYYVDDEEVYFRCADMPDGRLFTAIFNIGLDPIEEIRLYVDKNVKSVKMLTSDGNEREVDFTCESNNIYRINVRANTLEPVILFIKD